MSLRKQVNDYKEAIQIIQDIASGEITESMVRDIILRIAENHPFVLVEAKVFAGEINQGLESMVIGFLRANQKINAIKEYRALTGLGLRRAKDAVDEIEKRMEEGDVEKVSNANL